MTSDVRVQPRLLALGAAFFVAGLAVMIWVLVGMSSVEEPRPATDSVTFADSGVTDEFSRLWPAVGGGSMAVGLALIGIGMNRWGRARRTAP